MKRVVLRLATIFSVASPVHAQQSPIVPAPEMVTRVMWQAGAGYPQAAAGGFSVVVGKEQPIGIPGRSRRIRGVQAAADVGIGGVSGRAGWTDIVAYDAGVDGWSFDVVYLRPWLLQWGFDRGADYVGGGVTHYIGFLRLTGALLVNPPSSRLGAALTAGVVIPIR